MSTASFTKKIKKNSSVTQRASSQIHNQVQLANENSKLKYYRKFSNKISNNIFNSICYWSIFFKKLFKLQKDFFHSSFNTR